MNPTRKTYLLALALLAGIVCHATVLSWNVPPENLVNGCTGYTVEWIATNAPDMNKWQWAAQTICPTCNKVTLPVTMPNNVWVTVKSDRIHGTNEEHSIRSVPLLLDTNIVNLQLPLGLVTNLNLTP